MKFATNFICFFGNRTSPGTQNSCCLVLVNRSFRCRELFSVTAVFQVLLHSVWTGQVQVHDPWSCSGILTDK